MDSYRVLVGSILRLRNQSAINQPINHSIINQINQPPVINPHESGLVGLVGSFDVLVGSFDVLVGSINGLRRFSGWVSG